MANFTAGTSFTDGVTNDVTAAKLNALVADAVPTSNLSLNSTTGTIATFNSTTGTIATLNSTTPTFLGAITASTNTINVGSGQIYKDASGNVGVGTASPATRVDIRSSSGTGSLVTLANSSAASSANVVETRYIAGNTYSGLDVIASIGAINQFASTNNYGDIFFKTATPSGLTERLRIDSSGNVGIGTASADSILHIKGSVAVLTVEGTATSSASVQFKTNTINRYKIATPDSSADLAFYSSGTTERLRIDSSGGVTIAGLAGSGSRAVNASAAGLLSAASDASLKEEVVGAHIAGLDEILQIHPKMYRWKDDIANRGDEASVELGFIANDVAPIIPSAAPMGNDGLYGFYDRSITAALVKAVQELSAKVTALEAA